MIALFLSMRRKLLMQLNHCFKQLNHYLTIAKSRLATKEVTESENQMKYFLTAHLISASILKVKFTTNNY